MAEVADLADVNLAVDTFHREFTDTVPLAGGVSALPNMQGSGLVRDLREAMSQSPTLQGLVQQFAAATTKAEQMAIIGSLLDAWADTSGLVDLLEDRTSAYKIRYMAFGGERRVDHLDLGDYSGGGGYTDSDATSVTLADDSNLMLLDAEYRALIQQWDAKIHVLEAFDGRYFFTLPQQTQTGASAVWGMAEQSTGKYYAMEGGIKTLLITYSQDQINLLQRSYDALVESVYGVLVVQTRLQPYLNEVELVTGANGVSLNFAPMEAAFQAKAANDGYNAVVDLLDMRKYMGAELQEMGWSAYPILGEIVRTTTITQEITALLDAEHIHALGATDTDFTVTDTKGSIVIGNELGNTLVGIAAAADVLAGNGGNDTLSAVGYSDVLDGGAGDDTLGISGSAYIGGTTFIGGPGNDTITGAIYNDTYVFNLGDGQDTVNEYSQYAQTSYTDVLRFGAGIAPADITPVRSGLDLVFRHGNGTDQLTFKNWFSGTNYQLEQAHDRGPRGCGARIRSTCR